MPEYTLQQITEITQGKLHGKTNQVITNIETDSRRANTDTATLFIAIRGSRHDGHAYIPQAVERGIKNFIVEEIPNGLSELTSLNFVTVKNSMQALQSLATDYRNTLKMPVVAITGSNGKTVVKEWLAQCLAPGALVSRSPKSYNSQLGVPLSVWMIQPKSDWSIIEAGISFPGEMEKLASIIQPEYGIFTTLGPAHQENFKTLEEKAREKLKLFQNVKILYYCCDHSIIHSLIIKNNIGDKHICWSLKNKHANVYIPVLDKNNQHTKVELTWSGAVYSVIIPYTDTASVENCLHIITFLLHQGKSIVYVQQAISSLTPVAMRMEHVAGIQGSTLINDSYNSDIYSLRIALDYLSVQKQHQKRTVILSDIKQSGQNTNQLYAEVAKMLEMFHIDQLLLVGDTVCKTTNLPNTAIRFKNTTELLENISTLNISNHAVLIKGAREFGFEQVVAGLSEKKHTTVLEINQNHLLDNLNYFRGLLHAPTKIMVMVKALSYGSGSYEIANLLQHQKVDYLGVAYSDEGVTLRKAGILLPIMVMSPSEESYEDIIDFSLEPEIFDLKQLKNFSAVVRKKQIPEYPVHLKLDTGMHRLGIMPDEVNVMLQTLEHTKNIKVKAIFSHLAASGNPDEDSFTHSQFNTFNTMYHAISAQLGYFPMRHILNSAGIERFPEAHYEMVRLGIGLHGISSAGKKLYPVSTLKSRIIQIKNIPANETVGYNRNGKLKRNSRIALIPVGYADGLNRKLGNQTGQVIINNRKTFFIGDICMDLSMIDITDIDAKVGDEVIIFGKENPVDQIARKLGTIPYEILTSVSERVKRVYVNE